MVAEGMGKREKVYLKDTAIWDSIDHEASKEQFPETYSRLDNLTHGSHKKLVWKCSSWHTWQAKIHHRSNGSGCPFCSGLRVSDSNRLSINNPELVREWDFSRNKLTPDEVSVHSLEGAWWVCPENHSWQARIGSRSDGRGCPFCSGLRVTDKNRLSIKNPELARQWDFARNKLNPSEVSVFSNSAVWWLCPEYHSWQARVDSRSDGVGCPFCSGLRVSDSNRLSINNPELVREWDFSRNKLTPDEVSVHSGKRVHWLCSSGHSWRTSLNNRSSGHGCPTCAKRFGKIEKRFIEAFTENTDFTLTAHGMRLNQLKYESGRSGVEVDVILYHNNHYLLLEYDGNYWHRDRVEADTEKSRLLLSLGDNILHVRIRENDLPDLELVHDRFAQFQHDYHRSETDSIEVTTKEIEQWFLEKIGV